MTNRRFTYLQNTDMTVVELRRSACDEIDLKHNTWTCAENAPEKATCMQHDGYIEAF